MRKNKFIEVFFVLFFVLVSSEFVYGFSIENKVIKTRLKNGLTVLMLERHTSPTVSLYIRYRVGAVDEKEGESGAAHLLEHMMFKGTPTIGAKNYDTEKKILTKIEKAGMSLDAERHKGANTDPKRIQELKNKLEQLQKNHKKLFIPNEIDRLYTENGGLDMNASTGQDVTSYHISLPANKIELWARIESDRLINPVFREFYTERDVVMEERRQRVETDPHGKLYEQFMSTAYKTHPYRRPILGWTDDLMNLNPASLRNIFKKYRSPDNIVIAVVGDIDPNSTLKIINKYFGNIPSKKGKAEIIPAEVNQTAERRVSVIFDANPLLLIGYHKPTAPHHDDYVFDVLETILTKGRSSRLYKKLVTETEIAKNVSAANGIPGTRYSNLFIISAEPRFPHTNEELEESILKEIENIKLHPVSADELIKAKNHLRMGFIKSMDSNSEMASILSYYEILLGDYKYFSDYLKKIECIKVEDLQNVVQTYLKKENRTVAELKNKDNGK